MRSRRITDVSIVVPTFRRPALLLRCLEACLGQTAWDREAGEIVVVDNCPEASARPVLNRLPRSSVPVRYVPEPRPGISHARNTGVAASQGAFVAFIDDDNLPSTTWLATMLQTRGQLNADGVFGRIIGLPLAPCTARQAQLAAEFSRNLGWTARVATAAHAYFGTGNSLFHRKTCFATTAPFDPCLGLTGGEDTAFISQLVRRGAVLGWAPDALVLELVPTDRLTRRSLCRRRFRNGQIRIRHSGGTGVRKAAHSLIWMGVGAAQCTAALPSGLILDLLHQPVLGDLAWGLASGGLGKVLWWRMMRESYGSNHSVDESGCR